MKLNVLNQFGDTPLHYAVRGGDDLVVEELLSAGADVKAKGTKGNAVETAKKEEQDHLLPILEAAMAEATKDDEKSDRMSIVAEMLSTEKSYVESLTVLVDQVRIIEGFKYLIYFVISLN